MTTAERWKDIKAIGMGINIIEREGAEHHSVRYYILNQYLVAKEFVQAVRGHWGIENNLNWQLDMTFGGDQSRVRKDHGAENVSVLRRTALTLFKREKTAKAGIKNKRLRAGWDEEYLTKILLGT